MTTATQPAPAGNAEASTKTARLEHVNITASDPMRTAQMLCDLFGWHIRWEGESMGSGRSIHVGTGDQYIAIYNPGKVTASEESSYVVAGGLNHIALVVDDLDDAEARVRAAGFTPGSFGDYEPGRRFYFHDLDNIAYEIVSYR